MLDHFGHRPPAFRGPAIAQLDWNVIDSAPHLGMLRVEVFEDLTRSRVHHSSSPTFVSLVVTEVVHTTNDLTRISYVSRMACVLSRAPANFD
jgi:hypothetical protein